MTLKCAGCGREPREGEKLAKSPLTASDFCPQCNPFRDEGCSGCRGATVTHTCIEAIDTLPRRQLVKKWMDERLEKLEIQRSLNDRIEWLEAALDARISELEAVAKLVNTQKELMSLVNKVAEKYHQAAMQEIVDDAL